LRAAGILHPPPHPSLPEKKTMTIEAVSFAIGGILIATAIVGGGFEIKEIKMPKVGAAPRFFSMIVGAFFVMIGLGTWSFDRQQLLDTQVPINSLAPAQEAAPQPSQPSQSVTPAREVDTQAASPTFEPVQQFSGIQGRLQLSWMIDDIPINAYMDLQGANGIVRVSFTDPQTGNLQEVDQDLILQQSDKMTYYQGMNPRFASTQEAYPEYNPDLFRVVEVQTDAWTVTETCDVNMCLPVTAEAIPE
jgi:hypothetical protein